MASLPQIDHVPTQSIKKFSSISLEGPIDFNSTFSENYLDLIRNFDMELIGKFKINTVPNILRSDAQAYQTILASVLKGSVDAVEAAHEDRQLIYSRLLWLLPPLLLRNPKKLVSKRLQAFIQGDLETCFSGLCSTHDNHFAIQKTPASIHKLAADKVFNGQYSKAMMALLHQPSVATSEQKKIAMTKKHPPRSDKDNMDINRLIPSIYSPDITEDIVYTTAMKPSKRGVAPGPNGDRAEFLQSALYNPYSSSLSATVLHFLTRHINLERNGKLSEEWYQISTFSTLIAQGPKLRPIGMGYSGRKLVSGVSLTASAKEIITSLAPFQLSSLVSNGSETVVHLIRKLHELYGNSHVFFQLDVANAFNSVSRFKGLLAIARHLPYLYTYILRTYRIKNKLWVDATDDQIRDHILSQEGSIVYAN